jgi:exopolysaccharide biosynthesis protein
VYVVQAALPRDSVVMGDTLLLTGSPAWGRALAAGDVVTLTVNLTTTGGALASVRQAVAGRPIVLADSVITADVDTESSEGFRNLNPRTAVGIDRRQTRAWFAVIDGRQPDYSMGMTLRQVGALMQALGATRAINLDGGGSSALALRDLTTGTVRVVNRPSDGTERPVGNALAIATRCPSR